MSYSSVNSDNNILRLHALINIGNWKEKLLMNS